MLTSAVTHDGATRLTSRLRLLTLVKLIAVTQRNVMDLRLWTEGAGPKATMPSAPFLVLAKLTQV